jgi:thioredoxin 2
MPEHLHIVCPGCGSVNRVPSVRLHEGAKCGGCKQALFTGRPLDLTRSNFDAFITRNDIPVVVDFWAPWCGPCKMMAPAFAQAAAQLEPGVRLAKVNTENEQQLAARYGIRSIPTLVIFKSGKEVARQAGAMDAATLSRWIRGYT